MAELTNRTEVDVVLDRKLSRDSYGRSLEHDFIASQELTVTITLSEYRELVSSVATKKKDIDDANQDRYKRESEIEVQKKENEKLKAENYELKKQIDDMTKELSQYRPREERHGSD